VSFEWKELYEELIDLFKEDNAKLYLREI